MSHELKNPLASLKTSNELLINNRINEKKKILLIKNMQKDIERMNTLITDISSYTLTQVEIDEDLFYEFDLIDFLNNFLKSYETNYKNIMIDFEHESKPAIIFANKEKLAQVFFNLIDNSLSFSPINSKILIKLKILKDEIIIYICDQGPGITEDLSIKIFDRFYTDRESDPSEEHSGLGLSIAKNIIESCSGSLKLNKIRLRDYEGACFEINLPLKG